MAILLAAVPSGFFWHPVRGELPRSLPWLRIGDGPCDSVLGQGRQHADMFALTSDAPEASPLFSAAASLLGGSDPRDTVRTETSETLHHNRIG